MSSENKVISTVVVGDVTVNLVEGDITQEAVDAIVNAANGDLIHGGGVAGAISLLGGPSIQEESFRIAPVAIGSAAVTTGGNLAARWVIHAVGPRWGLDGVGEEADGLLTSAVQSTLDAAADPIRTIHTISMPAISTGIFGYPPDRASGVILRAVHHWIGQHADSQVKEIRICLYGMDMVDEFNNVWAGVFGG